MDCCILTELPSGQTFAELTLHIMSGARCSFDSETALASSSSIGAAKDWQTSVSTLHSSLRHNKRNSHYFELVLSLNPNINVLHPKYQY